MTVIFEHCNKIIAKAELSMIPSFEETVEIFGTEYKVLDCRHEVVIRQKQSGKKSVIEKIICTLTASDDI